MFKEWINYDNTVALSRCHHVFGNNKNDCDPVYTTATKEKENEDGAANQ